MSRYIRRHIIEHMEINQMIFVGIELKIASWERHFMMKVILVIWSILCINVIQTTVKAETIEEHAAKFNIQIVTEPVQERQYLLGSGTYTIEDFLNNTYWGDTEFASFDPQNTFFGFHLENIPLNQHREYHIFTEINGGRHPYILLNINPIPPIYVAEGEPIEGIVFPIRYSYLLPPEHGFSVESLDFGREALRGVPQTQGVYPLLLRHSSDGYQYGVYVLQIHVVSKDDPRIIDSRIHVYLQRFLGDFFSWAREMQQDYVQLYPETEAVVIENIAFPNAAIGQATFNGKPIETRWFDGTFYPNVYNIMSVHANVEDGYIYYFAVKDGVGYPFIVNLESSEDTVDFKITVNEKLKTYWESAVQQAYAEHGRINE